MLQIKKISTQQTILFKELLNPDFSSLWKYVGARLNLVEHLKVKIKYFCLILSLHLWKINILKITLILFI